MIVGYINSSIKKLALYYAWWNHFTRSVGTNPNRKNLPYPSRIHQSAESKHGILHLYHGSLNVPIEHGYYKVMSNIPKMGQLPTPVYKPSLMGI